jgi:hypothetical protein
MPRKKNQDDFPDDNNKFEDLEDDAMQYIEEYLDDLDEFEDDLDQEIQELYEDEEEDSD